MKKARNIAAIGALIWIIFKMAIYNFGLSVEWYPILIMTNMLALIIVIFLSLHYSKLDESQDEPIGFLGQFKSAMKAGATYSIIIFGFLFAYYSAIDTDFTETKKKEVIALAKAMDYDEI